MSSCPAKHTVKQQKSEMSSFSKLYLIAYNGLQTAGWSYLFFQSMKFLLQNRTSVGLWHKHGLCLLVFQSLAGLEVIHAITGLVPSNPFMTAVQISSRLYVAWGLLYSVPEIQDSPTLPILIFAWGLTEMVRYSFYTSNLLETKSKFLVWCRYSLFYALYPTGVSGEIATAVKALSAIKKRQILSITLPNAANISFSFYYASLFIILTYAPLFPILFNHMRHQRVKVLGNKSSQQKLSEKSK